MDRIKPAIIAVSNRGRSLEDVLVPMSEDDEGTLVVDMLRTQRRDMLLNEYVETFARLTVAFTTLGLSTGDLIGRAHRLHREVAGTFHDAVCIGASCWDLMVLRPLHLDAHDDYRAPDPKGTPTFGYLSILGTRFWRFPQYEDNVSAVDKAKGGALLWQMFEAYRAQEDEA